MAKSHKPTRADFEKFKAEFLRCVDLLNLNDWRIVFAFKPIHACYAEIETFSDSFTAVVTFNNNRLGDDAMLGYDPKRTARHEAGHLFFARLEYIGRQRFVRPDDFSEESERLCRVMETLLEP